MRICRTARADAAAGDAERMHYENDGPVAIIMVLLSTHVPWDGSADHVR